MRIHPLAYILAHAWAYHRIAHDPVADPIANVDADPIANACTDPEALALAHQGAYLCSSRWAASVCQGQPGCGRSHKRTMGWSRCKISLPQTHSEPAVEIRR